MHPYFEVDRPVVIGHRGAAGTHPENTLASFEAALAVGAEILESDVHLTRDGIPILIHDPALDRTTNGRGLASDLDWDEIRGLDAGYFFKNLAGEFPFRNSGIRVARLQDAFEAFPEARFNLEIKSSDPRTSPACLDLISEWDRDDRTLVTAGEDSVMSMLRETLARHSCRPALGACLGELLAIREASESGAPVPDGVMAIQIPAELAGVQVATPSLINFAHERGLEVHVWTVNDLQEIERLIHLGVDGIVTDEPGRMAHWKQRRSES